MVEEWKTLTVEGALSNYVLAFEQKLDVFNSERYLVGIPLNPILRTHGISVRSIDSNVVLSNVSQLVADMPESEMPAWLREAYATVVQISPMFDALSAQGQAIEVYTNSNDPYVPGLRGRTFSVVPIGGDVVVRDMRFEIDIAEVGRRATSLNIVHDDGTRMLAEGFVFVPELRRIYYHLSGFNRLYIKQWWSNIVEWLRMPVVSRNLQLNNIPIPEIRPSYEYRARAMPLEMITQFGFFDAGVELQIESPKAQNVVITARDLNFNEVAKTTVQISTGGELKRVRILSRGLGRLPDLNIEIKPEAEAKLVNARVLSWLDVWLAR